MMVRNSGLGRSPLVPRFSYSPFLLLFLISLLVVTSCQGKKSSAPSNAGGGYTLEVSGGTLNDGSGVNGLSVLATIRDSKGWGPTLPWTITISGSGIPSPLTVDYDDPGQGSYMSWEWASLDPAPGTYRATATNGATTIYCDFTITSSVLSRPSPNASAVGKDITVTWPAVTGAGSYAYYVCAPDSTCVSGITTTTSDIASFATLTTGDYLIEVDAYSTDRAALDKTSSSPSLAPQEDISEYFFTFPIGGDQTSGNYSFNAAGGIVDYDLRDSNNNPIYGLAIWTSIQDLTTNPTPTGPSGDWNIIITDPNGLVMNYIYPAGEGQDANWYYDIEPVSGGTYTVTATYGGASKTAAFSFANKTPALTPLDYSQISASLVSNATDTSVNDISISWPAVTNAKSYYVTLWADVWNKSTQQYEYDAVWSTWVNTPNALVLNGSVSSGLQCDVYVTAYQVDMTSAAPPATPPARADMSENYYGYSLPFATP